MFDIVSEDQKQFISKLVVNILAEDPIDIGDLPIDPEDILVNSMNAAYTAYKQIIEPEDQTLSEKHAMIIGLITKLIMENCVLQLRVEKNV